MNGYVKLHRRLLEHWVWHRGPWSPAQFWVYLVMAANYHESTVRRGLKTITVKRGQVLTSIEKLSPTLLRDRKTIRAWLRAFALDGMLDIETDHGGDGGYTLLTILNYEKYQGRNGEALDDALPNEPDHGPDDQLDFRLDDGLDDELPTSKKIEEGSKKRPKNTTGGADAPTESPLPWLDFLNEAIAAIGRTPFTRSDEANLRTIRATIRRGHTLDEAKIVVAWAVATWPGTKRGDYLRPKTLYGPTFDQYLNAARNAARNGHVSSSINAPWEGRQTGEVDPQTGEVKEVMQAPTSESVPDEATR